MKKIALLCITVFLCSLMLWGTASALTKSDAANWALDRAAEEWGKRENGTLEDYDHYGGLQCIDLIVAYQDYLGLSRRLGNAYEYASGTAGCTTINYSSGVHAEVGDIAVWKQGTSSEGEYGHVAIVTDWNSEGMMTVETGSNTPAKKQYYDYTDDLDGHGETLVCFLRPNCFDDATHTGTPAIRSFQCTGRDSNGFMIRCEVENSDCVDKMTLATWDNVSGNNPAKWQTMVHMTSEGPNIYKLYVKYDLFSSDATVFYNDIYYKSYAGEENNPVRIIAVAKEGILPEIKSISVISSDSEGYLTECVVDNEYLVDVVSISTWSDVEARNDSVTQDMIKMDKNTFRYYVHYSDHASSSNIYFNEIRLMTHLKEEVKSSILSYPENPEYILMLPENLTTIEKEAFANLESTQAIYIPSSVDTIDESAFNGSDILIITPAGSFAAEWARVHGIPFIEQ